MKNLLLLCFFLFLSMVYGMRLSPYANDRGSFSDPNDKYLRDFRNDQRSLKNFGFGQGPLEMNDDRMMNQMDNDERRERINQEINGFYNYGYKKNRMNNRNFANEMQRFKEELGSNFDEDSDFQVYNQNLRFEILINFFLFSDLFCYSYLAESLLKRKMVACPFSLVI